MTRNWHSKKKSLHRERQALSQASGPEIGTLDVQESSILLSGLQRVVIATTIDGHQGRYEDVLG